MKYPSRAFSLGQLLGNSMLNQTQRWLGGRREGVSCALGLELTYR